MFLLPLHFFVHRCLYINNFMFLKSCVDALHDALPNMIFLQKESLAKTFDFNLGAKRRETVLNVFCIYIFTPLKQWLI